MQQNMTRMERLTIKRVICTHKITLQLLWPLMMPLLLEFCPKSYPNLFQEIATHASSASNAKAQITSLKLPTNQNMLDEFAAQKTRKMSIAIFGGATYPMFTRVQTQGTWVLYFHTFWCMLTYFFSDTTISIMLERDRRTLQRWGSYCKNYKKGSERATLLSIGLQANSTK